MAIKFLFRGREFGPASKKRSMHGKQFSPNLSALKLNYLPIKGGNDYPGEPQLPLRWAY